MALADTGKAIGKVTKLLREHLNIKTNLTITVGRPEPETNPIIPRLNIFLYEAIFDPGFKNLSLDEGQPAHLWLVLKYIITAFDQGGGSDTIEAHEYLGEGIRSLQEVNFLPLRSSLPPDILVALEDNPEPLKVTFDEVPPDLLSKIMQGSDAKYRLSVGFQVRPVMIATGESPSYSLLVGVDYTKSPIVEIGEKGVHIPVIPSMGPTITRLSLEHFEVNSILTIFGNDLNLSGLSVRIGSAELSAIIQRPDELTCKINGNIATGNVISAGNYPVSVVQILPTGRSRSSNLLVGSLLPTLISVDVGLFTTSTSDASKVFGYIDLIGWLLATPNDDIFVVFYKDGKIVKLFDEKFNFGVTPPDTLPEELPLTLIRLEIQERDAIPPGNYRIIFRVNGQQAKESPEVTIH